MMTNGVLYENGRGDEWEVDERMGKVTMGEIYENGRSDEVMAF